MEFAWPKAIRQPCDLRRPAGVVEVYAKIAGGFADAAFLMLRTLAASIRANIIAGASCAINGSLLRQPYPLSDVLISFERGQLGAVSSSSVRRMPQEKIAQRADQLAPIRKSRKLIVAPNLLLLSGAEMLTKYVLPISLITTFSQAVAGSPNANNYLKLCANNSACEKIQQRFVREFAGAYNGKYGDQRNIAFVLGALGNHYYSDAIVPNFPLSCAWRLAILASGDAEVDDSDRANYEYECGRLDVADRGIAQAKANSLMESIYKRPLPMAIGVALLELPMPRK